MRWLPAECLVSSPDATGPRTALLILALLPIALTATGCRPPADTVRIAWDAPSAPPKGYRILVDDRVVMTIAPPPLDRSCSCPAVDVPVPPGDHKITVVAFNESGDSAPSAVTFVKK